MTAAAISYRLLGPLEVERDGRVLKVPGSRVRALLALLLLHANRHLARDQLIDELWGRDLPGDARNALQVHISRLRAVLGEDTVRRHETSYEIACPRDRIDLHRFEDAWASGRRFLADGDNAAAREHLTRALDLWRGEPLAEFAGMPFADVDARRLAELRLAAIGDRADAELGLGRHTEVLPELRALYERHPLQERPLAQLMLALYRAGRQVEALAACSAARERLLEEFGLSLSPAILGLERAILQQDDALGAPPLAEQRTILLAASHAGAMSALVGLAAPLAPAGGGRELLLARVLPAVGDRAGTVADASEQLAAEARRLARAQVVARSAAYTSHDPAADLIRLADEQACVLVLWTVTRRSKSRRPAWPGALHATLVWSRSATTGTPQLIAPSWCRLAAGRTTGRR